LDLTPRPTFATNRRHICDVFLLNMLSVQYFNLINLGAFVIFSALLIIAGTLGDVSPIRPLP
jgi:hypothetical protein